MIFSNNACMNILHITKVIIIILQGRNDWFGGFRNYYEGTFVPLKVWNIRSKVALQRKSGFWLVHVRFSSETIELSLTWMPTRELGHFTVERFFGTGKTPLGWLHARGWVGSRSRPTRCAFPSMRGSMWTRSCGFPIWKRSRTGPNGTWYQPSLARIFEGRHAL